MINLIELFTISFFHFIGDFVFQTHWQSTNKSKNNLVLTYHVTTYSLTLICPIILLFYIGSYNMIESLLAGFFFVLLTFIFHWVTDYFTSRLNSKWKNSNIHYFFISIGLDHFLHYMQLFLTYYFIKTI